MTLISDYPDDPKYTIHAVSKITDILTVTMRAWERRYQVITPKRGENGYRLYSERDIATLNWLKKEVDSGVSISAAAAELKNNMSKGAWPEVSASTKLATPIPKSNHTPEQLSSLLFETLLAHDQEKASALFDEAAGSFSLENLLEKVIAPTLVRVGEAWFEGRIRVATEHLASTFIRSKLLAIYQSKPIRKNSPKILVGSAPGELHEIGPIMVSLLLRDAGYQVEYLGPDIPLDDLVLYAESEQPKMIILSATMKDSVEDLKQFKLKLNTLKKPPYFGFGGSAFVYSPDLVDKTPGTYLGKTLGQSVESVRTLLKPGKEATTAG